MIHLYARVSTDKQENGREAQVQRLLAWAGDREHVLHVDEDVSAYNVQLSKRPAGKAMYDALRTGDTVVITKVDRVFRRMHDFAVTRDQWKQLGIELVVIDLPADLTTPPGKLFLSMLVAMGEFESDMHGQRKREVYAYKKSMGLPYNGTRPYGWVSTKDAKGKLVGWAKCEKEREVGERVLAMRNKGMSYEKITLCLAREGVQKPVKRKSSSGYYHLSDVYHLVHAAKAGYPVLPREFWQAGGREQRLRAATGHGSLR